MSTTQQKLQQIQADARQEHDGFTQNTHKDTTCSAVGSILVKLRDSLGEADTSEAFFQGWVAECVALGIIPEEEEESFFKNLWNFLCRNNVIRDDDKVKIFNLDTRRTEAITLSLREMLARVIMAFDDVAGFEPGFQKKEGLAQVIEHLRFAFDRPRFCNTGVRNSIVEVLHKQYRFLEPNGERGQVAYVLSDLGSDIECVMRDFYSKELALMLKSDTQEDRERGFRILKHWMQDNLNWPSASSDWKNMIRAFEEAYEAKLSSIECVECLENSAGSEIDRREISEYVEYLHFRTLRPDIQTLLLRDILRFFESYGVAPTHHEVKKHISERLPLFTALDYPDVPEFSKAMVDVFSYLKNPAAFTQATQEAFNQCKELDQAALIVRPELRIAAVLEQAKRYESQLPFGAAELELRVKATQTISRLFQINPKLSATEQLALISQWEDELNEAHRLASLDHKDEVRANSFAHLLMIHENKMQFLVTLDDCLKRPALRVTESELRTLLESIPRKEGSTILKLSPEAVNATLWHAIRTSPLDWSLEFQNFIALLIEQLEGPQKHYNDQKWIEGSYPPLFIEQLKWLLECARHQEIQSMPKQFFMACNIRGLERNALFRQWIGCIADNTPRANPFPIHGWFLDMLLDRTWSEETSLRIMRNALPVQCFEFASALIKQKMAESMVVLKRIPHRRVLENILLAHWDELDMTEREYVLRRYPDMRGSFLLEVSKRITTFDELMVLRTRPLTNEQRTYILRQRASLVSTPQQAAILVTTALTPAEVIWTYSELLKLSDKAKVNAMLLVISDLGTRSARKGYDQLYGIALYIFRLVSIESMIKMKQRTTLLFPVCQQLSFLYKFRKNGFKHPAGYNPDLSSYAFLAPFYSDKLPDEPSNGIIKRLLKRVASYFDDGVLENAELLLTTLEQSQYIDVDPCESKVLVQSKSAIEQLNADPTQLRKLVNSGMAPRLDSIPEMAVFVDLREKLSTFRRGFLDWSVVVEKYQKFCSFSVDSSSLPHVITELRKHLGRDLTPNVKIQVLMKALTTPLDQWDPLFKELIQELIRRPSFEAWHPVAMQLDWMLNPGSCKLTSSMVLFPFVLGSWPDPIPEFIIEGLEQNYFCWQNLPPNLDACLVDIVKRIPAALTKALTRMPVKERRAFCERFRDDFVNFSGKELVNLLLEVKVLPLKDIFSQWTNEKIASFISVANDGYIGWKNHFDILAALPARAWIGLQDDSEFCKFFMDSHEHYSPRLFLNHMPIEAVDYFIDAAVRNQSTILTRYFDSRRSSILTLSKKIEGASWEARHQLIDEWRSTPKPLEFLPERIPAVRFGIFCLNRKPDNEKQYLEFMGSEDDHEDTISDRDYSPRNLDSEDAHSESECSY